MSSPEREMAVLAIPETCVDSIISLYHSSLFVGHQGVIKTYLAISNKFSIPNLTHYLKLYIKACHICQLSALTHIMQIRGNFDVANSSQYHAGSAPMLFQWSHSHMKHFSL